MFSKSEREQYARIYKAKGVGIVKKPLSGVRKPYDSKIEIKMAVIFAMAQKKETSFK